MNIKKHYISFCQKLGALFYAPSQRQGQVALFLLGVGLLITGVSYEVTAQAPGPSTASYNETRLEDALEVVFAYLEGSFGALVMIAAGIGAILSSAFGQYRAALGLLVVAVGAFILRSLTHAFFEIGIE